MTCKTCMTLRAKFVRWLGIRLGVMKPIEEQPKEESRMEFTPQQALIKIGALALENDVLQGQLQQALTRIKELESPEEKKTELKAV